MGFNFHQQKPLLKYIVDFYCTESNLVIEVDGDPHKHEVQYEYDLKSEAELKNYKLENIRFTEQEVRKVMDNTLRTCLNYIENHLAKCSKKEKSDNQ